MPALRIVLCCLAIAACGGSRPDTNTVVIAASDYAFQTPAYIGHGQALFRLSNTGKVPHELAMGLLRPGITADSVLTLAAAGGDPGDLTDGVVGILIAAPGDSSLGSLQVDLLQGRTYMLICQFQDADTLPPHIAMGMHASFVAE